MRRALLILLTFLAAGCSPVGPAALLGLLGISDGGDDPIVVPAVLTVDSLLVEGDATDTLDDKLNLRVDNNPVPVTGGTFTVQLDTRTRRNFLFEAADDAGNVAQRNVQVE